MPMKNPPHPGRLIRDSMETMNWTVTEFAKRLGIERHTLSQFLDGHTVISPEMALALERVGWSNADFWMRV